MGGATFLFPEDIRAKARRFFESHVGEWAEALFLQRVGSEESTLDLFDGQRIEAFGNADAESVEMPIPASEDKPCIGCKTFRLGVPTEKQAQAELSKARKWVEVWRAFPDQNLVEWEMRDWPSLGSQKLPKRVNCVSWIDVSRLSDERDCGVLLLRRIGDLAQHCREYWGAECSRDIARLLKGKVRSLIGMDDLDWSRLLGVIDWVAEGRPLTPYARQLPIRGIDTKWMEHHCGLVEEFGRCVRGLDFAVPHELPLVRVRMLDESLYIEGLSDITLPIDQLAHLRNLPANVIVCENRVSLMTLPSLPKTMGIFGAGYAVANLSSLDWLVDVRVLYWGDLDTNGFAILNLFRQTHPHARSVMMDMLTLERYMDLAVAEDSPNNGTFQNLTEDEQAVLKCLKEGEQSMGICSVRLEQERIEWQWACEQLKDALGLSD